MPAASTPTGVRPGTEERAETLAGRWTKRTEGDRTSRDLILDQLRGSLQAGSLPPDAVRDLRGIQLIDEDLRGVNLSGLDLSGANLSRANLGGCKLVGTKLRGTILYEAQLQGCELLRADLTGADLTEANAERASFGGADLTDATLFNAQLSHATLTQANMTGADFRAATLRNTRLRESNMTAADFSRAEMESADLEKSVVSKARFVDANLRKVTPRGISGYDSACWIGADIMDVDFCGAYLVRRTIMDQNYLHEFRAHSKVNAGLYWVWWATSDCGRSFLRWGLWTVLICAVFAGAFDMVAVDYGDYPTQLSPFYYSVVTLTTLGYGDVLPASPAAQVVAMAEVTLGYVMLGGLLSIFSNKMARRAD